jgi:dihydroorotase
MKIAIIGGRIIDPANGIDSTEDLFVADGTIVARGKPPEGFTPDRTLNVSGLIVAPGLIDLCARLREPGAEQKATISSESLAAVKGGITTLCMPPDTKPVIDTPSVLELIRNRAEAAGGAKIVAHGALTKDLQGEHISEMAALQHAGCVGVSDGGKPVSNSLVLRRVMQYATTYGLTVFLTPADPWLIKNGCAHEGAIATRLGLPELPVATESAAMARDIELIEKDWIQAHFCRLSSARATVILRKAQERGLPISADVSAHQLFLTEENLVGFDSMYNVYPPLRALTDRAALREAIADGTIQAICSDHQPHENDAKLGPFATTLPGISTLETFLPLILQLVSENVVDLSTALMRVTSGPANILGLDLGTLGIGKSADICIFNPQKQWVLDEKNMRSQGKNSPYLNQTLTGEVQFTLVNGRVAFEQAS